MHWKLKRMEISSFYAALNMYMINKGTQPKEKKATSLSLFLTAHFPAIGKL